MRSNFVCIVHILSFSNHDNSKILLRCERLLAMSNLVFLKFKL